MRKMPPPELFDDDRFSRLLCWRSDIKAGFSIWWKGVECTGGIMQQRMLKIKYRMRLFEMRSQYRDLGEGSSNGCVIKDYVYL